MLQRLGGTVKAVVCGLAFVGASACATGGAKVVPAPTRPPDVVVLIRDMTGLVLEWQFFDVRSDSLAAGIVTAKGASWCAKIPIPATAESARLFNGAEDLAFDPLRQPYWTLELRNTGAFVQNRAPPC